MKIHRFLGNFNLNTDKIVTNNTNLIHQVLSVLRLKASDKIMLCDGFGFDSIAVIENLTQSELSLKIIEKTPNLAEPKNKVHLYLSLIKKDLFELTTLKSVECGAIEITPIITKHTIKKLINVARLMQIAKEAVEQSGRSIFIKINKPSLFRDAINSAKGVKIFCDKSGDVLERNIHNISKEYSIFIGPEGGWSEEELNDARVNNSLIVKLSPSILRSETAAIVSTYLFANR